MKRSSSAVHIALQVTDNRSAQLSVDLSACPIDGGVRCPSAKETSMTSYELGVSPVNVVFARIPGNVLTGKEGTVHHEDLHFRIRRLHAARRGCYGCRYASGHPTWHGPDRYGSTIGKPANARNVGVTKACRVRPLLRRDPTDLDRDNGFLRRRPGLVPEGFGPRDLRSPSTSSCATSASKVRSHRRIFRRTGT